MRWSRRSRRSGTSCRRWPRRSPHLPTGLAIFDRSQKLVLFNPALTDLTGLTAEELAGRPHLHVLLRHAARAADHARAARLRQLAAGAVGDDLRPRGTGATRTPGRCPRASPLRITGRPHPDGAVAFLIEDISRRGVADAAFPARARAQPVGDRRLRRRDRGLHRGRHPPAFSNSGYREMWDSNPDEALHTISVIDATRHWQSLSEPTPFWGELRDFVRQHGERARWDGEVVRTDGARAGLPRGADPRRGDTRALRGAFGHRGAADRLISGCGGGAPAPFSAP